MKRIALAILALTAVNASAGQLTKPRPTSGHCRMGQSTQCWAPYVAYRENLAGLDQESPVYITRFKLLFDGEHDFEQREDAKAYVDAVLMVKGFWVAHPTICDGDGVKCLLVTPSAIESVQLRQIVDRP